jgi:hypothetical protein
MNCDWLKNRKTILQALFCLNFPPPLAGSQNIAEYLLEVTISLCANPLAQIPGQVKLDSGK